MGWNPHTISLFFQYHVTSCHTIGMIGAFHIPGHAIPSLQSCHWVSGVLFTKHKNYSAGVSIGALGSILCGHVLQAFAGILSYKWRLYSELHPLKISSIGLYPRVCCGYSTTSYLKLYILPWPFN